MENTEKRQIFGKSYNVLGTTEGNLILQSRGDVKIRWGNKYIDLVKNGKIAGAQTDFIFNVSDKSEIKKDGIYIVDSTSDDGKESKSVYVNKDGNIVQIASDADGYISYTKQQEDISLDQQQTALQNIGFYFLTKDDAIKADPEGRIVYILEDKKLYKLENKQLVDYFATSFSSAMTQHEEDTKKDTEVLTVGNITIDGKSLVIKSGGNLTINAGGVDFISYSDKGTELSTDIIFDQSKIIKSSGASPSGDSVGGTGWLIYNSNGESYIEADHIINRNKVEDEQSTSVLMSPSFDAYESNIVIAAEFAQDENTGSEDITYDGSVLYITTKYKNSFKAGDKVIIYVTEVNALTTNIHYDPDTKTNTISASVENPVASDTVIEYKISIQDADGNTVFDSTNDVTIKAGDTGSDSATLNYETELAEENCTWSIKSGDTNISSSSDKGNYPAPTYKIVEVTKEGNPFTVSLPGNKSTSDSVTKNLIGSYIYKLQDADGNTNYIRHYKNELDQIELINNVETIHSKIGNLAGIKKKNCDGTESDETFTGYGIYTDNLVAIDPKLYNIKFNGICPTDYPEYDKSLMIPTEENAGNEEYKNKIPNVEWIQLLIKQEFEKNNKELLDKITALEKRVKDLEDKG